MQKLKEQLKGLDEELHKTPATLEELKQVLNVINTIRSTSMNMELRYVDLEERFRQVEHVGCRGSGSELSTCFDTTLTSKHMFLRQNTCECQFKSDAEVKTCSLSSVKASRASPMAQYYQYPRYTLGCSLHVAPLVSSYHLAQHLVCCG